LPWLHSAEHLELVADGEGQKWEPTYSDAGPANMLHLAFTDPTGRLKRFRHSSAGPLTLHSTSLLMADDPTIRIVILHPATASDAAKLERLAR
jgi:hypothetical protein